MVCVRSARLGRNHDTAPNSSDASTRTSAFRQCLDPQVGNGCRNNCNVDEHSVHGASARAVGLNGPAIKVRAVWHAASKDCVNSACRTLSSRRLWLQGRKQVPASASSVAWLPQAPKPVRIQHAL